MDTEEAWAEREAVGRGQLPRRYAEPWAEAFLDRVRAVLRPGLRVLDVGSGARPALSPGDRPAGCHYTGLDISERELDRAPAGSYDEAHVGDISGRLPALRERFDLVLSWQVLEHVPSMAAALDAQHDALVPGGHLVAQLSGGWAIHAVLARVIPYRVSNHLMTRLLGSDPEGKFPTRYDCCTDRALRSLLSEGGWGSYEVVPRYKAAGYLRFSPQLQRVYLGYENWAATGPHRQLATHYIVQATRQGQEAPPSTLAR